MLIEKPEQIIITNNVNAVSPKHIIELSGVMTPNTKRAYLADIRAFFEIKDFSELTTNMVAKITVSKVNKYFQNLSDEGYSPATINRKLQALSKFYKYMSRREVGIIDYNPFSSDEGAMRFKAKNYSNTRSLTDDEVRSIMETLGKDKSILGIRNKIIVLILATTGLRRSEIAEMRVGQITTMDGQAIIEVVGKGNKERFVVIAKGIKDLIDTYLGLRGLSYQDKQKALFVSHSQNKLAGMITAQTIYNTIKEVAGKAGLEAGSISPHCFRHTYVTKSLDMGCPLEDVQDRVGHSDISTTRRYDHTRRMLKGNPADAMMDIYSTEN